METLAGLLVMAGIGVMVWAVVYAVRRRRCWDKSVARGFWLRLGTGLTTFIIAGAVVTPVAETELATDKPGSSENTTPPSSTAGSTPTPSFPAESTSPTRQGEPVPEGVPEGAQRAVVKRVMDGDTVELAELGAGSVFRGAERIVVRLLGIDAPAPEHSREPVQCFGAEASNRLKQLTPTGSRVWVQRDTELRDQYGRYLLYVWNSEGTFVNHEMVAGGFAQAELYPSKGKRWTQISEAEEQSRAADTGVWGACTYFGAPKNTPQPPPPPEREPEPKPEPEPADDCAPGYTPCVPPYPPDVDCGDVSGPIMVTGSDPHGLDGNGNGVACES